MPETHPLRFSRKTLIAAIKVLERMTHAQFSEFMLELSPDLIASVGDEPLSLRKRLNNLVTLLDNSPDRRLDDGTLLRDMIVERAAAFVPEITNWLGEETNLPVEIQSFVRAAALDGFTVSNGTIRSALPLNLGLSNAENEIDHLLERHGMITPKGHLDQALDAHARGDWAAANAQIRTFLEALFDELAVKLDPAANSIASGHSRRERLAALGFLSADLNEWDAKGLGYFNGLMKRLHPQGSHPGLSGAEDSTFRLHLALLASRLLLTRFDTRARL